jgi:hypothetical protein
MQPSLRKLAAIGVAAVSLALIGAAPSGAGSSLSDSGSAVPTSTTFTSVRDEGGNTLITGTGTHARPFPGPALGNATAIDAADSTVTMHAKPEHGSLPRPFGRVAHLHGRRHLRLTEAGRRHVRTCSGRGHISPRDLRLTLELGRSRSGRRVRDRGRCSTHN